MLITYAQLNFNSEIRLLGSTLHNSQHTLYNMPYILVCALPLPVCNTMTHFLESQLEIEKHLEQVLNICCEYITQHLYGRLDLEVGSKVMWVWVKDDQSDL